MACIYFNKSNPIKDYLAVALISGWLVLPVEHWTVGALGGFDVMLYGCWAVGISCLTILLFFS